MLNNGKLIMKLESTISILSSYLSYYYFNTMIVYNKGLSENVYGILLFSVTAWCLFCLWV